MIQFIHEIVAANASEAQGPAFETNGSTISYAQLDRRASQIANLLISRGVKTGDVVAIHQHRSVDLFAGLLGVLKSGAAYAIVDPASAADVAAAAIGSVSARLVLTTSDLNAATAIDQADAICIDESGSALGTLSGRVMFAGAGEPCEKDIASVSAPTGEKPASRMMHRDMIRLARSIARIYGLQEGDRCAHHGSLAFDVVVDETLAMLSAGVTVVLDAPDAAAPAALERFVMARRINVLSATPRAVAGIEADLPTLTSLVLGAAVTPSSVAAHWAFKVRCLATMRRANERFPSFCIEQETGVASRPRLLTAQAA